MKLKGILFLTSLITIITLTSFISIDQCWSAPKKTSKPKPEDLVNILDLSKPAFFTPQNLQWGPSPAILPKGASMAVLEGNPMHAGPFTIRLRLPADYELPAHWSATDEHISVISGHLFLGMGDKLDRNKSISFPAGSFARIPLKMHHYAWTPEETIIQLHGTGPWIIGYANALDDPTKPLDADVPGRGAGTNAQSLDNMRDTREEVPEDLDLDRLH